MVYSRVGSIACAGNPVFLANTTLPMNLIDWIVLAGTIAFIVLYGVIKTRKNATLEGHLRSDNTMKWWMIGVSIMATQASAVTFLSTPGQAIEDGMRFLQFYFGLPLAMVVISVTIVPIYYRLKVYTAYEYLESRFDLKTRILAAILFLILRGLSVGITLFAPALVLSTILDWPISVTTFLIGSLVIVYVVSGGSKAVSLTQRYQMAVIMTGMILAGVLAFMLLPKDVSFGDTVQIAGHLGKLNLVNLEFDPNDRYNIWSGLIAGTFLFLSYFGTDQSQVSRYLGGASVAESKMGLMFNGLLKIPMQFMILFIGVLVYVFYLFIQPPVFHNEVLKERAMHTDQSKALAALDSQFDSTYQTKRSMVGELVKSIHAGDDARVKSTADNILKIQQMESSIRDSVKSTIAIAIPGAKIQDRDYIFLNFVLNNLPHGIIGLLLAVMFSAAMSSMAGELSALSTTTTIDLYQRAFKRQEGSSVFIVRSFTILWALIAMVFAMLAGFAENLIQFVNIVGSLFYGTILGIFLTAFYVKSVRGTAVFWAAVLSEAIIFYCYLNTKIAFLHYNIIGCAAVVILSLLFQSISSTWSRHSN
jgi:SSS family solute:Na+ symporter